MNSFRFTYGSEIRIFNVFFRAKKSSARRRMKAASATLGYSSFQDSAMYPCKATAMSGYILADVVLTTNGRAYTTMLRP